MTQDAQDEQDKPARGRGRPPYEPTERDRRQARQLAALLGGQMPEIAKVLGISVPTLRKYLGEEIALGNIKANANVAKSLYRMATSTKAPSVAAAIFWLKSRAGWTELGMVGVSGVRRVKAPPRAGKKEIAAAQARNAQKGTEWDDLLPRNLPIQ